MKTIHIKTLSICLIIVFLTNSTGYALESLVDNENQNCGTWEIETPNEDADDRLAITPLQKTSELNCGKVFTTSNKTSIFINENYSIGGYAMELSASETNSTADFLLFGNPYIVPDLEIEAEVAPIDFYKQANVTIEGRITLNSILVMDLPLFLLDAVFDLANFPNGCIIPDRELIEIAYRTAPIFENTVELALAGRIPESTEEFSRVENIFFEKVAEVATDLSIECLTEFLLGQIVGNQIVAAKITVTFLSWVGTMFFDYMKYGNMPATINLSYSPIAATSPSSDTWIAFEKQSNIWLIHPDQKGLTQVSSNQNDSQRILNFKWSPDGKSIAYSLSTQGGNIAILLYDIQTSTTRTLLSDDVGGSFDWSLTGKQIIYDTPSIGDFPSEQRNKGIWVVNLDNGKTRQIVKPPKDYPLITNPKWSSEGSHVIFTVPCFEMNCVSYGVANFESGKGIILPVNGGTCEWSPVDLQIACTSTITDNSSGKFSQEIVILDITGKVLDKFPVLDNSKMVVRIVWLPNGTKIALGYYSDGKGQTDILSLETGERLVLTSGIPSAWSPNGEWILTWKSELNSPPTISLMDINFGEVLFLSEGSEAIWQP